KGSVVAAFFKAYLANKRITVYGDGEQTRDFVYVGDLASVIVAALRTQASGVFQLGSGRETSVNALLKAMSKAVGEDLSKRVDYQPVRKGEITRTYCDISLARKEIGFSPDTDLAIGLAATWAWFQSQMARAD